MAAQLAVHPAPVSFRREAMFAAAGGSPGPAGSDRATRRRVRVNPRAEGAIIVGAGMPVTAHRIGRVRARRVPRAAGFLLVEALVAMFVVAMGILALAGLLQAATRYSKMSELRSTATLLASDIADRIRANPGGGELGPGGYDITDKSFPSSPAPPHAACTSDAPCGPGDLARLDLADWTARLRATLPKGSASIQFHAGTPPAPDSVDVWVGWADPLTLSPGVSVEHSGIECPDAWRTTEPAVRCVYLQVAL